jgi:conserved oligomeric Golgi complex subunit 6
MQAHTKAASMQISQSLADAELLQSRRDQIGIKHTILSAFQKTFTLPEEQIVILTSATEPVDQSFFEAFERVKSIHSSCQALLTTEHNRAGFELSRIWFGADFWVGLRLWNR